MRDSYGEPYEYESLRKFLAGEPDDLPWMRSWLGMVGEAAASGRRFARVRVVTMPLTDYSRFGVWCAQFTNAAGEDIRYLPRDQAAGLPEHDYWLFDSRTLVKMLYEDDNSFIGGEVVDDPAEIVQHNYWRDAAWHRAVRRDDFAAEHVTSVQRS